jgi:beta-glucosidase
MQLKFPEGYIWGTSTAAYQIESASDHDWKGFVSKDGTVFDQCSMHDHHRMEDLELICQLGNGYRMSCDWGKLQKAPYADFDQQVVDEYLAFMQKLKNRGVHLMLVLHHFTNPRWFVEVGSWEKPGNRTMWLDFVRKSVAAFGHLVDTWNTFNEPMVYISNGWIMGNFPPFKKGKVLLARKVLKEIAKAHDEAYEIIKMSFPNKAVGISKNTVKFVGEVFPGHILAKIFDYWFMDYGADHFTKSDFQGMSYYARMPFRPLPITEIDNPGKLKALGRRHDQMWEYRPKEFYDIIHRYWKKYKKPIIITETGICTADPQVRIESIKEYAYWIHKAIQDGIPILGQFYWTTMDNHEWNLGLTYRFGLVYVDFNTFERTITPAGIFYGQIAKTNIVEVDDKEIERLAMEY